MRAEILSALGRYPNELMCIKCGQTRPTFVADLRRLDYWRLQKAGWSLMKRDGEPWAWEHKDAA
jgi:hypothetical protein